MHYRTSQTGISLVEVLVSLLLLSIAVLGYSALQTTAIKSTDESLQRTQSLAMMRTLAEKIRLNPSAKTTYANLLKSKNNTTLANKCRADASIDSSNKLCTAEELAAADIFYFKQELQGYDFDIQMHPCPSNKGTDPNKSMMFAYCLIAAWGDTTPTIGNDSTITSDSPQIDCLAESGNSSGVNSKKTPAGSYHPNATCLMLEL